MYPGQYPQQQPPHGPFSLQPGMPPAYVITKPGGLTGGQHAIHILITLFTCGFWLPGYIVFAIMAPSVRRELVTPIGASVPAPATPAERQAARLRTIVALSVVGGLVLLCAAAGAVFWFVDPNSLPG